MDRRIKKTKKAITEALLRLTKDKPISQISVTELCLEADIPRSTFYSHYNGIQDFVREYLESYSNALADIFREDYRKLKKGNRELFFQLTKFVLSQKQLSDLFFGKDLTAISSMYIEKKIHPLLMDRYRNNNQITDEELLSDMATFSAHGVIVMVTQWVHDGYPISPDEMTDRIVAAIRAYTSYFTEMFPL